MLHLRILRSGDSPLHPLQTFNTHKEIFDNLDEVIAKIPEGQRYNVFYTVGHGEVGESRKWEWQDTVPFDIDGAVQNGEINPRYLEAFYAVTKLDPLKTFSMCSGNGLQLLVQLPYKIENKEALEELKKTYKSICKTLDDIYAKEDLPGRLDPVVFSANRLMRLPGTMNFKKDKANSLSYAMNKTLEPQGLQAFDDFYKLKESSPEKPKKNEFVSDKELRSFKIDTTTVESECRFLAHAKANQETLSEPEWYAALGILVHLDNWHSKVHEYSKLHKNYTVDETDNKAAHAKLQARPRRCESINQIWSKCHTCPHFGKINSPIALKGPDFIATEETGFTRIGERGAVVYEYEDLLRYLKKESKLFTDTDTGQCIVYNGTHYEGVDQKYLKTIAYNHFRPMAREQHRAEFTSTALVYNPKSTARMKADASTKLNFKNGVFDWKTGEFCDHSPEYFFTYTLPFDYSPQADSVVFKRFLSDVTKGDTTAQNLLLEYIAYGIFEPHSSRQVSLLLLGSGGNGKSAFLDIVKNLAGPKNCSHVELSSFNDPVSLMDAKDKLFNFCEEMPRTMKGGTEIFKKAHGGEVYGKKLYEGNFKFVFNTKMILAANELPTSWDPSQGFFRRIMIVPFDAYFSDENRDYRIVEKCCAELSGIFNMVHQAYQNLLDRGRFCTPESHRELLESYKEVSDSVGSWFNQNLDVTSSEEDFITISNMYEAYRSSMDEDGDHAMSKRFFVREIGRKVGRDKIQKMRSSRWHGGKTVRCLNFLKWKNSEGKGAADNVRNLF